MITADPMSKWPIRDQTANTNDPSVKGAITGHHEPGVTCAKTPVLLNGVQEKSQCKVQKAVAARSRTKQQAGVKEDLVMKLATMHSGGRRSASAHNLCQSSHSKALER